MSLLFASLLALVPAAPEKSVIAVFEIIDVTERLTPVELEQLTDYFSTSLAKTKGFEVVPKSDVRQALDKQKAESYKACYDESCQIEIGRELAAQKSVVTRIIQVGTRCAITSTILDVARSASERASTVKSDCNPDAIVDALDEVVKELSGAKAPEPVTIVPPPPPLPPPVVAPGTFVVVSEPAGSEVRLDSLAVGQTPLTLPNVAPGLHRLEVARAGHLPYQINAQLGQGEQVNLDARLVDEAEYAKAEADYGSDRFWSGMCGAGAVIAAGTAVVFLAVAPTEKSIATGSYDAYLRTGVPGDPFDYRAVEDDVSRHNTMLTGALISAAAAAVLTGLTVVFLSGDEPEGSSGELERGRLTP